MIDAGVACAWFSAEDTAPGETPRTRPISATVHRRPAAGQPEEHVLHQVLGGILVINQKDRRPNQRKIVQPEQLLHVSAHTLVPACARGHTLIDALARKNSRDPPCSPAQPSARRRRGSPMTPSRAPEGSSSLSISCDADTALIRLPEQWSIDASGAPLWWSLP